MPEPLAGYTVVEMTLAVQGPAAGLYLRDMGAEVIKIEPPIGDPSRYGRGRGNSLAPGTIGPQFVAVNRGKRSVCLDLTTSAGQRALQALLDGADVFLTNYRASALARLGLDYDSLQQRLPDLVYGSVNGFGPRGEDSDKAMLDGAAVARSGMVAMTGYRDRPPSVPGAIIGDTAGAMQLALGIVTALLARERHGGGQQVRTSALGAMLWLQQWELTHIAITGARLRRDGNHHPNILGPYGAYETSCGGAILIAQTMQQEAWDAFCIFADEPELAFDPRLQTPGQRLGEGLSDEDSEEIRTRLARAFKRKSAAQWDDFLRTQPEVIWERVRHWDEVLEDPQVLANHYLTEIDVPGVGRRRGVGNTVQLSRTPGSEKGPPPLLGEHTRSLLAERGFDDEALNALEADTARVRAEALAALGVIAPD